MYTFLIPSVLLICFGLISACSTEHRTQTTTHETVESVPANPITIEKKTTTQTETHTED